MSSVRFGAVFNILPPTTQNISGRYVAELKQPGFVRESVALIAAGRLDEFYGTPLATLKEHQKELGLSGSHPVRQRSVSLRGEDEPESSTVTIPDELIQAFDDCDSLESDPELSEPLSPEQAAELFAEHWNGDALSRPELPFSTPC